MIAVGLLALTVSSAGAQERFATHIIDIGQGSELSESARRLAVGGYELADGTWVSLRDWYHTDWPDTYVDLMTQFGEDFGLLWGFSTGERGEKYTIDPGLRLGFIAQGHPKSNAVLSLTAKTILGGRLNEHACEADYGDIGGVQPVNCRLAASFLPPAETLQYLVSAVPRRLYVSLSYSVSF